MYVFKLYTYQQGLSNGDRKKAHWKKAHRKKGAPEKNAYVYKRMGKKRTQKEAHTEKSALG